jgi:Rod binding domain-containing protein
MPIASIQSNSPKVKPEDIPLEKIADSKALTESQKTTEMTRQFEALLLRQVLTEAQKPAFKSALMPNAGVSASIYQDMMVNQLAEKISSARTLGLAQELESQVSRQLPGHHEPKTDFPKSNESQKPAKPAEPPVPLTKAPRL